MVVSSILGAGVGQVAGTCIRISFEYDSKARFNNSRGYVNMLYAYMIKGGDFDIFAYPPKDLIIDANDMHRICTTDFLPGESNQIYALCTRSC